MKNSQKALTITILLLIIVLVIGVVYYSPPPRVTQISPPVIVTVQKQKPSTVVNRPSVPDMNATDTESIPYSGIPYSNVNNISEQTGLTVISSPTLGDTFLLGDIIHVKWNPEFIDVSTITLLRANDPNSGIQIYRRDRLGDQVSVNAEFDYRIPGNLTVYPGLYVIKVFSVGSQSTFTSDVFNIESSVPLRKRADKMFSIKSIAGSKNTYSIGEVMSLNIEAADGDGTIADASKGFNVQARLYNNDNQAVWSGNATFNTDAQIWHVDIPISKNSYRVNVILYCGVLSLHSICAQEYDSKNQAEQFINFSVSQ